MVKTIVMLFCFIGFSRGDNIYLKNGYIHQNVRITGTEGNRIEFMKNDTVSSSVKSEDVLRIEFVNIDPQSRYSFALNDSLAAQKSEGNSAQTTLQASAADQALNRNDILSQPLIPSRHNALRIRGDWGNPVGMKISAGIIVNSLFAFDIFISNYGTWSNRPNIQRYGISAMLFTNFSIIPLHPVIPYFQIERGFRPGGFILGGGDNFSQIGAGLFVPIYQNTSIYISQSLVQSRIFRQTTLDGTAIGVEVHFTD